MRKRPNSVINLILDHEAQFVGLVDLRLVPPTVDEWGIESIVGACIALLISIGGNFHIVSEEPEVTKACTLSANKRSCRKYGVHIEA